MTDRSARTYQLSGVAIDPEALLKALWPCTQLRTAAVTAQTLIYLDTADQRLRPKGRLLAKPHSKMVSLLRECADTGRPVSSCRCLRVPASVQDVPRGCLHDQLQIEIGDAVLTPVATLELRRTTVVDDQDKVRLLLECGERNGEVLGSRVVFPQQTSEDVLSRCLCETLDALPGVVPVRHRSWCP